jgi:uncharacterized protein with GYD domain
MGGFVSRYVWMGKYSAQGCAAVAKEGLTSRKMAVEQLLSGLGMKMVGMWGLSEPEWDFIVLGESDSDMRARHGALTLTTMSTGMFERFQILSLLETEEVDDARKTMPGYRAPGSSS